MGLFGKKKKAAAIAPANDTEKTSGAIAEPLVSAEANDSELIAVITAAIAAYTSEQYVQTLYIRKINRIAGERPVWGKFGTTESIDMRRM